MTTYKGLDGYLAVGGVLVATYVRLNAGQAQGVSVIGITGLGSSLTGAVVVGDTFTIAGESGTPTHTFRVLSTTTFQGTSTYFLIATGGAIGTVIGMTPAAAAGGIVEDSVITFANNVVGEVLLHSLDVEQTMVDDSVMGETWDTMRLVGPARWSGTGECYLDYDDSKQGALLDQIAVSDPTGSVNGILLATKAEKFFYGEALLSNFVISTPKDGLVTVTFAFVGTGSIRPRWD